MVLIFTFNKLTGIILPILIGLVWQVFTITPLGYRFIRLIDRLLSLADEGGDRVGLRVLIAEDVDATGIYLRKIIEEVTDIQVVGIAKDGKEAVRLVEIYKPHVVILDVEMPEMNGIDAAREIVENQNGTHFVFVTAYPDFAIEAFELYSFDYILKPINHKRVKQTLRRLKEKILTLKSRQSIIFQVGERRVFLNPDEILYIESRTPKVLIKTEKEEYLTAGDLSTLEQKLTLWEFFRCHKGYLVNPKYIKEVVPFSRTFIIILRSGDKILLSREKEKALREKLS